MSTSILSLTSPLPARLTRQPVTPAEASPVAAARRISSQSLMGDVRELVIQHRGSEYHLRLTRNDKLILTK